MSKKDIYQLMVFSVLSLLMLALAALVVSSQYSKHYTEIQNGNQENQQKFDQFVENVKNGKLQLTTDKWIEDMKLQRAEVKDQHDSIVPLIEFLQFVGWFSLILAACNVLVVLYVKDKIKKRQNGLLNEGQKR